LNETAPPLPSRVGPGVGPSLARDALVLVPLLALPLVAVVVGAAGPRRAVLNLGPGDHPYVRGFTPGYEIDDKVATHWTEREAEIELPLRVEGGPAALAYRVARNLNETGRVEVFLDGRPVDAFPTRRFFEERRAGVGTLAATPVVITFKVSSRIDRGLRLDWVALEAGERARVWLRGAARFRPALLVLAVFVLLRGAGWSALRSAALTAPLALLEIVGLVRDPWLVHRLLTDVPEWLAVGGALGIGIGLRLRARGSVSPETLRTVAALVIAAFVVRAAFLNAPDYYYPDLRSHARLALEVHESGLGFFAAPASHVARLGTWYRPLLGGLSFPYTPAFHVPFALSGAVYDEVVTSMKLAGAALAAVAIALAWALAGRLGASPAGAALLLAAPIYGVHLTLAYLPAVFGHVVDLAFLCWLAGHRERIRSPAVWATAALLVAACELAYVNAIVVMPLFVLALATAEAASVGSDCLRRAAVVLGFGLAGSLLAVVVYYRDFLAPTLRGLAAGAGTAAADEPARGYFAIAAEMSRRNFGLPTLALAAVGLVLLLLRGKERPLLAAWLAAYGLVLLGRSLFPAGFGHSHEALFLAPLLYLGVGETIAALAGFGRKGRLAAGGLLLVLMAYGLVLQERAWALQLGNAR
jgi:hypothetical protein